MPRVNPFADSKHLSTSSLELDNILPSSTHIIGKINQFKPPKILSPTYSSQTDPLVSAPECHLTIQMVVDLPNDSKVTNDYVASDNSGSGTIPAIFSITLGPKAERPDQTVDEEFQLRLEGDVKSIGSRLGRQVTISTEGLKVVNVEPSKPLEVQLEGFRERLLKSRGTDPIKLFHKPVSSPSSTPAWFGTPSASTANVTSPSTGLRSTENSSGLHINTQLTQPPPTAASPTTSGPSALSSTLQQKGKTTAKGKFQPLTSINIPNIQGIELKRKAEAANTSSAKRPLKKTTSARVTGNGPSDVTRSASPSIEKLGSADGEAEILSTVIAEDRRSISEPVQLEIQQHTTIAAAGPSRPRQSSSRDRYAGGNDQEIQKSSQASSSSSHGVPRQGPSISSPSHYPSSGRHRTTTSGVERSSEQGSPGISPDDHPEASRAESSRAAQERERSEEIVMDNRRREAEERARQSAKRRRLDLEKERESERRSLESLRRPLRSSVFTYMPLNQLRNGMIAHLMGVVIETVPPKKSKDWMMSVVIGDPSTHLDGGASEDIVVGIFRRNEADLPKSLSPGTPILFRNLKIQEFKGKCKANAFSEGGNTWAFMPGGKKVRYADEEDMIPPLETSEIDRLKALRNWWTATYPGINGTEDINGDGRSSMSSVASRKDAVTLGEARTGLFFDAICKILHIINNGPHPSKPALELYVSDGTISPFQTRNFHNFTSELPPSAVFCLGIYDMPEPEEMEVLQKGKIIKVANVRVKMFRDELEMSWSNKVTEEQRQNHWRNKKCTLIANEDDRARVINTRINALKRGEIPKDAASAGQVNGAETNTVQVPEIDGGSSNHRSNGEAEVDEATHISTIHTDEVSHPLSSLADINKNSLVPNKFRVKARIKSLHVRGLQKNQSYIQRHCLHCDQVIAPRYCSVCQDIDLNHAAYRYRFIALLEDKETTLPVIIADGEAAEFLPPLPPLSSSHNPNDVRRQMNRLNEISREVDVILLGRMHDGERTRPIIDWTIETLEVKTGAKGETAVVQRVFGMKTA